MTKRKNNKPVLLDYYIADSEPGIKKQTSYDRIITRSDEKLSGTSELKEAWLNVFKATITLFCMVISCVLKFVTKIGRVAGTFVSVLAGLLWAGLKIGLGADTDLSSCANVFMLFFGFTIVCMVIEVAADLYIKSRKAK